MAKVHMVAMGDMLVTREPGDTLMALGLGSCIGLCAFDPSSGVAGMAHIVLPSPFSDEVEKEAKFATTCVPRMMLELERNGGKLSSALFAIIGGAHLFQAANGAGDSVGARNAEAARATLASLSAKVALDETGGSAGRTVQLAVSTGILRVKILGKGEQEYHQLSQSNPTNLLRAA